MSPHHAALRIGSGSEKTPSGLGWTLWERDVAGLSPRDRICPLVLEHTSQASTSSIIRFSLYSKTVHFEGSVGLIERPLQIIIDELVDLQIPTEGDFR